MYGFDGDKLQAYALGHVTLIIYCTKVAPVCLKSLDGVIPKILEWAINLQPLLFCGDNSFVIADTK